MLKAVVAYMRFVGQRGKITSDIYLQIEILKNKLKAYGNMYFYECVRVHT